MQKRRQIRKKRRSFNPIPLIIVVGIFVVLNFSRGLLNTTYKPPSPEIEQLALATTMTPKAQQLFYRQDPKIQSKEEFRTLCRKPGRDPEKTIILGCFTSNGYSGSIVIQAVSDPRLEGTMEVVAAHEMLHAAFQQLNRLERPRLEPKLKRAAKLVTDSGLRSVLATYEKGDPDIYFNELHSHLGTELEDLGDPDLERHYQQYFEDRQRVIAFAKRSRRELGQLEAKAAVLKPEIDTLERILKSEEQAIHGLADDLRRRVETLRRLKTDLQSLRQETEESLLRGSPSLVSAFEQQQRQFNETVQDYNAQVETHRERVAQYNRQFERYQQKIETYNQLTLTQRSILSSLKPSSRVPAAPPLSQ